MPNLNNQALNPLLMLCYKQIDVLQDKGTCRANKNRNNFQLLLVFAPTKTDFFLTLMLYQAAFYKTLTHCPYYFPMLIVIQQMLLLNILKIHTTHDIWLTHALMIDFCT